MEKLPTEEKRQGKGIKSGHVSYFFFLVREMGEILQLRKEGEIFCRTMTDYLKIRERKSCQTKKVLSFSHDLFELAFPLF